SWTHKFVISFETPQNLIILMVKMISYMDRIRNKFTDVIQCIRTNSTLNIFHFFASLVIAKYTIGSIGEKACVEFVNFSKLIGRNQFIGSSVSLVDTPSLAI